MAPYRRSPTGAAKDLREQRDGHDEDEHAGFREPSGPAWLRLGSFAPEGERGRQREEGGKPEKEERGLRPELARNPRARGEGEQGPELLDRAEFTARDYGPTDRLRVGWSFGQRVMSSQGQRQFRDLPDRGRTCSMVCSLPSPIERTNTWE